MSFAEAENLQKPKPRILQTIVVEGRDDMSAVLAAADANVIWTNGYGIRPETLDLISAAYEKTGIVIFTDPDHAGRQIRERLTELFPQAKQAHLTQSQAEKDGDIGIENASPDGILKALAAAGCLEDGSIPSVAKGHAPVTMEDLISLGLAGTDCSSQKRAAAGAALGIGTANSKTFLKRLAFMDIGLEELRKAAEV